MAQKMRDGQSFSYSQYNAGDSDYYIKPHTDVKIDVSEPVVFPSDHGHQKTIDF